MKKEFCILISQKHVWFALRQNDEDFLPCFYKGKADLLLQENADFWREVLEYWQDNLDISWESIFCSFLFVDSMQNFISSLLNILLPLGLTRFQAKPLTEILPDLLVSMDKDLPQIVTWEEKVWKVEKNEAVETTETEKMIKLDSEQILKNIASFLITKQADVLSQENLHKLTEQKKVSDDLQIKNLSLQKELTAVEEKNLKLVEQHKVIQKELENKIAKMQTKEETMQKKIQEFDDFNTSNNWCLVNPKMKENKVFQQTREWLSEVLPKTKKLLDIFYSVGPILEKMINDENKYTFIKNESDLLVELQRQILLENKLDDFFDIYSIRLPKISDDIDKKSELYKKFYYPFQNGFLKIHNFFKCIEQEKSFDDLYKIKEVQ